MASFKYAGYRKTKSGAVVEATGLKLYVYPHDGHLNFCPGDANYPFDSVAEFFAAFAHLVEVAEKEAKRPPY
jgi:hypothetical protein